MVAIILGRGLVFWSGVLAGLFTLAYLATCYISPLRCMGRNMNLRCKIHALSRWPTIIFVLLHIILAVLASFRVYI